MGSPAVMESCTQTQKETRVAPYLPGQLGQIHMVRGRRSDFRRSANAKRIIVIISYMEHFDSLICHTTNR